MNDSEKLGEVKKIIQEWIDKQGHDRCWYYPELFRKLVGLLDIKQTTDSELPSLEEFKLGCEKFQKEEYKARFINS